MSNLLAKIFSVTNEGSRKVICFLGIKIKFKSKKLANKIAIAKLEKSIKKINKENTNLKEQIRKTKKDIIILKEKYQKEIDNLSCKLDSVNEFIKEYKDISYLNGQFLLLDRGLKLNSKKIHLKSQVNEKMQSEEYKLIDYPCLCGSQKSKLIAVRDRYGICINTVICEDCGLVRTNPYYDEKSLNDFYNTEYRPLYSFTNDDKEKFFNQQIKIGEKILKNMEENIDFYPKNKFVYEIGTGMGGILKPFYDAGATIKGVDLGEEYINIGINSGLDLEVGSIDALKKYEKCDLLILNHVLEHITNPIDFLKDIRELLKEDSLLYIAVPTLENIGKDYKNNIFTYLQNAHAFNFSLATLTYVIECAGYTPIININSEGAILCKKCEIYRNQKDINKEQYKYTYNLLKEFDKEFFKNFW